MLKPVKADLEDLADALEHLKAELPRMTISETIDVAARLRAAVKTAESIDALVKDEVKKRLKHKAGEIKGEMFKAVLAIIATTRLDQTALKEGEPDVYERYCRRTEQERVNFELK